MTQFLLDCSLTIAWFFSDEVTEYSESVLKKMTHKNARALVPSLWELEVSNVFLSKIKRKQISFTQASECLKKLKGLDIRVIAPAPGENLDAVFSLAHDESLTSYDAAYLQLALKENLPLASLDKALCAAAKRVNVRLF